MRLAFHRITPVTPGPCIDLLKEDIYKANRPDTVVDTKARSAASKSFNPYTVHSVFTTTTKSWRIYENPIKRVMKPSL